MPADPYVYPGTEVLRNRFGIRDADELARREGEITIVTLAQLENEPLPGNYDLAHLRAMHAHIFGDVYPWAGEFRTVQITKDSHLFALPQHMETYLSQVLDRLAQENHLRGLERDVFLDRVAESYADINAVHPFREGNGRTQRAFVGQLAQEAGYSIAWDRLDPARNIDASIASHDGNNAPMRDMFDDLVEGSRTVDRATTSERTRQQERRRERSRSRSRDDDSRSR